MATRDDDLDKKPMTFRDLTILMEGYRNNIELTSTLLEQQKQLLTQHDSILKNQSGMCTELSDLAKNLNQLTKELKDDLIKGVTEIQVENVKAHSSLKNIFYVALVGGIAILGVIIDIVFKLNDKVQGLSQAITKLIGG